jgi:hypothetical protein
MKKPEQTPIDPKAPRSKQVTQIPMPKLYPESMDDDVYCPDSDCMYTPINKLDKINKLLDEAYNEDSQNSN